MKIEFLRDVKGRGEHVMRIFDFNSQEARLLKQQIETVIDEGRSVDLSGLDFIQTVNCYFSLRISGMDMGVLTNDDHHYFLKMSVSGYKNILTLLEPYCQRDAKSYTWLYDLDNPIELLLSAGEFVPNPDDIEE